MDESERAAITRVARAYYVAMATGDGAAIRELFDGDACFWGRRDGADVRRNLSEFVSMVETPAIESPMKVDIEIVDSSGELAMVKLVDLFRGRMYTDYLILARKDGVWKIIVKTFWAHDEGAGE